MSDRACVRLLGRDRAPFLPSVIWVYEDGGDVRLDRDVDPRAWQAAADADAFCVTQWNDDEDGPGTGPGVRREATSSASMPTAVKSMLDALDVREGHRVLDVGGGTGFSAALLKDRAGPHGSVSGIEIDARIAVAAQGRLRAVGVDAEVMCGDGLEGWLKGSPYDRVHVGVGVRQVPVPWLTQTRAGGRIVLPWGTGFSRDDVLVALDVTEDGSACGRFGVGLDFMKLRAQRTARPDTLAGWLERATHWEPEVPGSAIEAALGGFGEVVLGFLLPGVVKDVVDVESDAGARNLFLYQEDSVSAIGYGGGYATSAAEFGPVPLATRFFGALQWWHDHGRPDAEGFGLTVSPDGEQSVWFGSPDSYQRWTH